MGISVSVFVRFGRSILSVGEERGIVGNGVLCVLMSVGGERLLTQCTAKNLFAGGAFSLKAKLVVLGDIADKKDQGTVDGRKNARRSSARERVLIKNWAREKRRKRPLGWLVAAPRTDYNTNGLQTLNGHKPRGISFQRRLQCTSKRPKTQREGEERGQRKRPVASCCYLRPNFVAELENVYISSNAGTI